jgi:glycosyltransferase involved in cell wall biosynthesis
VLPLPVNNGAVDDLPFEERQDLLFVGSSHPPNADAVRYYADVLAPAVAERLPGVELQVVGEVDKRLGKTSRRPESGVRILGYVPSLADHYRRSRVFVAPLRYGAGVKGKILEAMSHGLPVVTTSVGAEGLSIRPGVDVMVADDVEEFARAVESLYLDRETWKRIQANGRGVIERHYTADQFESAVRTLLDFAPPSEEAPADLLAHQLGL